MRSLIIFFLLSNFAYGAIDDIYNATCRININGYSGTGTVFKEDKDYYWILTAGHVGSPSTTNVNVYFYHEGKMTTAFPVEFVWRTWIKDSTNDLGLYKCLKPNGVTIKPIPLAPRDYKFSDDEVVWNCGCANGSWATVFRGRLREYTDSNKFLYFTPSPSIGRSGSALFDRDCTKIIAVVVMSSNDTEKGIAVPLSVIYEHLEKQR